MANSIKYGKPSMTNLPADLGETIFKQIINTPAPDRKKMKDESAKLVMAIVKERDKEDAKRNFGK